MWKRKSYVRAKKTSSRNSLSLATKYTLISYVHSRTVQKKVRSISRGLTFVRNEYWKLCLGEKYQNSWECFERFPILVKWEKNVKPKNFLDIRFCSFKWHCFGYALSCNFNFFNAKINLFDLFLQGSNVIAITSHSPRNAPTYTTDWPMVGVVFSLVKQNFHG